MREDVVACGDARGTGDVPETEDERGNASSDCTGCRSSMHRFPSAPRKPGGRFVSSTRAKSALLVMRCVSKLEAKAVFMAC